VDGKVKTDVTYPCGFQDVISIEKTDENFRLLHDTKGRFVMHRITSQEAAYKLCRVKALSMGTGQIPYVVTHDGRTIRFPDPLIKTNDTVKVDLATNKIVEFAKFEVGNVCAITAGHNIGRIGTILHTEKHPGGHNIVHLKDKTGATWATRQVTECPVRVAPALARCSRASSDGALRAWREALEAFCGMTAFPSARMPK
jgi:small subunit ribosomal protein S4e